MKRKNYGKILDKQASLAEATLEMNVSYKMKYLTNGEQLKRKLGGSKHEINEAKDQID